LTTNPPAERQSADDKAPNDKAPNDKALAETLIGLFKADVTRAR